MFNYASATIVQFQTNLGNFEVNLFDQQTPITVANFLDYAESEAYNHQIVHRSVPNFIVQGGGFRLETDDELEVLPIPTDSAIVNEAKFSNVRGTLAMAKLDGDPDSATSQWFINLNNNAASLDQQNGGLTVFGQVLDDGMSVLDTISELNRFNLGGAFTSTPLIDYTAADALDNLAVAQDNYVKISHILVIDAAINTAENLSPVEIVKMSDQPSANDTGGGGPADFLILAALGILLLLLSTCHYVKTLSVKTNKISENF